ncbi:Tumor necrosis factor receptor superfamily member 19 [Heterocephalus glaber]|uniref:Tumor necrosis factor receptor superfamily member 19 n=1 Tax=Heterocephalus glaber TaxID=10181 RepID=G5AMY8_HETGA|nr:Tumor necrosis factor receptor superfamily member 19 [Heterocephalus glaber]
MAFKALQEQEKTFFTIVLLLGYLKANCSVTSDAVCGDCLPGFYRKTKLVGFQDMECVPCGDPPPPYEPHLEQNQPLLWSSWCTLFIKPSRDGKPFVMYFSQPTTHWFETPSETQTLCCCCRPFSPYRPFKISMGCCTQHPTYSKKEVRASHVPPCRTLLPTDWKAWLLLGQPNHSQLGTSKVNLVKIASTASSPRDTALAAVICSALATVLLALLILCVIYCKRQFMEKKPSWSLRSQDIQYNGSELSCFDRPHLSEYAHRACCQCYQDLAQAYGPVHLIPSLCCEGTCGTDRTVLGCGVHSVATLQERNAAPVGETMPMFFASLSRSVCGKFSDACPLMQNPTGGDDISFCDSYPELTGEEVHSLDPENESSTSLDSNSSQDLVCGAVSVQALSADFTDTADLLRHSSTVTEPTLVQDALPTRSQLDPEGSEPVGLAISLQDVELPLLNI